ncbi:MAG TPA: tetratricopeptide repeat protein, partial [Armatimonadota bacterium]|nr:tetratricopeptide repeat protein [Armatimonadota bacterium]
MTPRERGLAALRAGDAGAAVSALREAVRQSPTDTAAWGGLGVALCRLGQPAEGLQALDHALAMAPGQPGLHFNRGHALELLRRTGEALEAYRQALTLAPNHTQSLAAVQRLTGTEPALTMPAVPAGPLPDFELPTAAAAY